MNYKRHMQNSKEYKELVSNLDTEIKDITENIKKLNIQKEELGNKIATNDKNLNLLELKKEILTNKLNENIKKTQKANNTLKFFVPGALLTTILLAIPSTTNLQVLESTQLFYLASSCSFIATLTASAISYFNPHPNVKEKTIKEAMAQDKNIKLNREIKTTIKRSEKGLEQYRKDFQKYESINSELFLVGQEKANLLNQRNTIMSVMKNYDNTNNYQRLVNASINKKRINRFLN